MTRYINADVLLNDLTLQKAAFETVHDGRSGFFAKGVACGLDGAIQSVKNAETEDVSPVKHGKWQIEISEDGHQTIYQCGECGHQFKWIYDPNFPPVFNYCQKCGSRMQV